MFVDDEVSILSALRRSLYTHRGRWDMRFVGSAAEAISMMERDPVDVVIADFRMPGMDGGQLLTVIRERWPDTARLMLSGHTEEEDLLHMVTVAQRFLDKPCERNVLVDAIESALRSRTRLDGATIRAEIGALSVLPSAAATLDQLQVVLDRSDTTEDEVAAVVQRDIGLTVKVVQLANSALFGGSGEVSSINQALVRLGVQTVRSVALMHGLAEPVRTAGMIDLGWLDRLNAYASLTAQHAVRLVAPEQASTAICAAILAECGQLVFATCRPSEFEQMLRQDPSGAGKGERERFGLEHSTAGSYLLELWGFPVSIVSAVGTHDQLPAGGSDGGLSIPEAVQRARLQAAATIRDVCAPRDAGAPETLGVDARDRTQPTTDAHGAATRQVGVL
jgi:HD-like signal output (HDOD) protein/CheY-like chemotaxis protein